MNTQELIQNIRERVLPLPKIQFPCPVCQRDIEIRKTDTGADLLCPHCTAWIAAPVPDLQLPPQIRDQNIVAVRQFQKLHGRSMVDLKRGSFQASVLRKQQRIRDDAPTRADIAVSDPSVLPPPQPGDAPAQPFSTAESGNHVAGIPETPGAPSAQTGPPPRPRLVKGAQPQNTARSFQPLDSVTVAPSEQDHILRWEEDRDESSQPAGSILTRSGQLTLLGAGALLLILLLALVSREMKENVNRDRDNIARDRSRNQEIEKTTLAAQLEDARKEAAIDVARKALASLDWTGLLPYVRHPDRVRPLMEDYYATHSWAPISIAEVTGGQFDEFQGHHFLAFGAKNAAGENFVVGMEQTGEGWKLDWEVVVPLAQFEWDRFVKEHSYQSRRLRVSAIKRTPTEEMRLITRIPDERAFGVMLWCTDISGGSLYAVLEKDSGIARELSEFLSVSQGKKLIVEAAFLPVGEDLRDDLVVINRIVTKGWTILDDNPPEQSESTESDFLRKAVGMPTDRKYAWMPDSPGTRMSWKNPAAGL